MAHVEAETNPQGPITRRRAVLLIVCAWLLALGIAFFLNRGEDAGQLAGSLRRAFGAITEHRVVGAAGLLASAEGLLIASLIVLAWLGLGDLALRFHTRCRGVLDDYPPALALSSACLSGAVLWSMVWMGLGVFHLYRGWVAVTALIIGTGCTGLAARRLAVPRSVAPPLTAPGRVAVALIAAVMLLALTAALAPPTARDALFYHFALPKAYVTAGAGVAVPYNMATFYPQGVEMQVVWAMLLGRLLGHQAAEAAAGATVFAFAPEDYTLAQYVHDARSAADIRARARAAGITHLLVRHDVLLDYATSPIVDDRQPREHNLAKLDMLTRFFREGTRLIRGDRRFWLIELPVERRAP